MKEHFQDTKITDENMIVWFENYTKLEEFKTKVIEYYKWYENNPFQ